MQQEYEQLQKAFALACRILAEYTDCPAADAGADWPECSGELDRCGESDIWECWQKYMLEKVKIEPVCRVCGCTQHNACPGGCYWVAPNLCSVCLKKLQIKPRIKKLTRLDLLNGCHTGRAARYGNW